MEYSKIKHTDLSVSRICMGGCPMGGYGWGAVDEAELIDAVHAALDNGINFFDTADTYGLGQSEITLGKALGAGRKDAVITTKFGVCAGHGTTYYDNRPEYIVQALDASLKRLNTDYIDLYVVHYRDGVTPLSVVAETLERLKEQGKIRYYGLSNVSTSDYDEIRELKGRFVSFQDEYSLACRKNEEVILQFSQELEMTPMTWGSLGQGILTGKYDKNSTFGTDDRRNRAAYVNFHGEKLLKNLEIVEEMKKIASAHQKPVAAVAIRFILDYIPDSVVLCGAKRPSQVLSNIEGSDWSLSDKEIEVLDGASAD